jgi:hypothetical protein
LIKEKIMSIRENVKAVKRKILLEVIEDDKSFTADVQDKALKAILDGVGSASWREYMQLFVDADRPDQLARLMAEDGTKGDKAFDRARAYLVADGPCGTDTVFNFGNFASAQLDVGLDEPPQ